MDCFWSEDSYVKSVFFVIRPDVFDLWSACGLFVVCSWTVCGLSNLVSDLFIVRLCYQSVINLKPYSVILRHSAIDKPWNDQVHSSSSFFLMDFDKFIQSLKPLRHCARSDTSIPMLILTLSRSSSFNENALRQRFQAVCAMLSEDAPLSTTTSAQCRQPKNMWEEQVEQSITKKWFFH